MCKTKKDQILHFLMSHLKTKRALKNGEDVLTAEERGKEILEIKRGGGTRCITPLGGKRGLMGTLTFLAGVGG